MDEDKHKKEVVESLIKKNILLSPDILEDEEVLQILTELKPRSSNLVILNKDVFPFLDSDILNLNWIDFDQARTIYEKDKDSKAYSKFIEFLSDKKQSPIPLTSIKVLFSYKEESKKRSIQDFVSYFNARYVELEKLLRNRQELQNLISINRILAKRDKENISFIGLVKNKQTTSGGNILLEVEDQTGSIKALINKNKPELFEQAQGIVLDEVIGIVGVNAENIVFINNILWPDIPTNKELKKSPDECYAVFLSDFHVGSDKFLPKEFNHFLQWLNGEVGTEKQKEIAKKIKYAFIVGDLVDGLGIYPEQDAELVIKDIYQQYEECAKLLKKFPKHINLIICPGNHDAMRIAEPQPELYKDFAKPIWELPNITMVSNPAYINIHSSTTFPGFDVLLYHGYSFDYFVANVDPLRNKGGYDRADLIMKFLLQRRHLAPTHASTLYLPDANKDPLIIDKIPDFFITGHIHNKPVASNYKNITLLSCGCWQAKTPFQEKVGHNPGPARVPIVNLQTREVKILNFEK